VLRVSALFEEQGARALGEARLHGPQLRDTFERYLVFGGLPAAVSEAVAGQPEPSEEVRNLLIDSLGKDVLGRGVAEPALFALLGRVLASLGSKTSYSALARAMDVPLGRRRAGDYRSVKDHLELLAAAYQILIVYFWRPDADAADLSRDKKIYLAHPLAGGLSHRCPPFSLRGGGAGECLAARASARPRAGSVAERPARRSRRLMPVAARSRHRLHGAGDRLGRGRGHRTAAAAAGRRTAW